MKLYPVAPRILKAVVLSLVGSQVCNADLMTYASAFCKCIYAASPEPAVTAPTRHRFCREQQAQKFWWYPRCLPTRNRIGPLPVYFGIGNSRGLTAFNDSY